ncbi:EamA family transporter [Chromobacterium sphagni]|uniref:EamA family transporter n=1 Tax=Chromobacterium sphagni TaxID=1903179 RepID=UPI00195E0F4B|nr:hypothetical protein [Chromobacterium sphagni]
MFPPLARRLPAPAQRGEAAARLSRLALGAALGLLSMACVQLGSAWSVPAMRELGPFSLTWLRLSCAAVLLAALVRPPLRELARGHRGLILGLGGAMAGMMLCFFAALRSMPLGLTVAVNFLGPLLVAVAGARRRLDLAWPLLALLGVLLLARHQGQWQADAAGLAFAAAAAACWGGYIVLMKRAGQVFRGWTA